MKKFWFLLPAALVLAALMLIPGRSRETILPVLLYHAFCPEESGVSSSVWVSADRLEEQLAALKEAGYRSVPLADLIAGKRLPEKPIKRITPDDCQRLLDGIKETGKGKTTEEIRSLLMVIFKMAIAHNLISHNPLDVVLYTKHENEHGEALTKAEEGILFKALEGNPYRSAFALALYTGLRPNEYKTAKIEGKFIVAINSKRKNGKIEYKKIPITKMLAPYLEEQELSIPCYRYMREKVKEILPNHKLYDLRTTFYSRCKECGISEHAMKEFVGHSLGALGNAYTDLSDEFLLKEGEKFVY